MITIRPSVPADFDALGLRRPYRLHGMTGIDEAGKIIGLGGVAYAPDGQVFAFSELTPDAAKYRVTLHKAGLKVLETAKAMGIRELVACADMVRSPAAERWLERLGFMPADRGGEKVWIWNVGN